MSILLDYKWTIMHDFGHILEGTGARERHTRICDDESLIADLLNNNYRYINRLLVGVIRVYDSHEATKKILFVAFYRFVSYFT